MAVKIPKYVFLSETGKLINTGISRSIILSGNIYDLFLPTSSDSSDTASNEVDYIPLVPFLCQKWNVPGFILLVYELNTCTMQLATRP